MRDDITNELYMPLSSTVVPKQKKEILYVSLDFENGLTIEALVDSGAYVSSIGQKEFEIFKQQAPSNVLKIDNLQFSNTSSKWPARKTNSNNYF